MATGGNVGSGSGSGSDNGKAKSNVRVSVRYGQCLRNHGLTTQVFTLDGCGEFTPKGPNGSTDAMICAACGCYRNFHRKIELLPLQPPTRPILRKPATTNPLPPPPPPAGQKGKELRKEKEKERERERVETREKKKVKRFTEAQRGRMREMAEKLGWKVVRHDEEEIEKLCEEIDISPSAYKSWINNNRRRALEDHAAGSSSSVTVSSVPSKPY